MDMAPTKVIKTEEQYLSVEQNVSGAIISIDGKCAIELDLFEINDLINALSTVLLFALSEDKRL